MNYPKSIALVLGAAIAFALQSHVVAQVEVQWSLTTPVSPEEPTVGDWTVGANWSGNGGFVPEGQFDEIAEVQDGTTARVSTDVTGTPPGGVIVDDFSTIDITPSGKLKAIEFEPQSGPPLVFGLVDIDSAGTLRIAGSLEGETLLNRGGQLRTVGNPNLSVTIHRDAQLTGTQIFELTGPTHNPIRVGGEAELGGTVVADFNGATPALGTTWDLVDAQSYAGEFSAFEINGATLPDGQGLGVQQVSGGVNGTLLQLLIEQKLFLNFNRETMVASIQNSSESPVPVSLDGYTISSGLGSLNQAGWNSLDAQGADGNTWSEAPPDMITMNSISESNATASATIPAGGSLELGAVYSQNFTGAQFNQELEDHAFIYNLNGRSIEGAVTYTGDKQYNNIVLTVDPTSGAAVIQNESEISVEIDSYSIFSPSNSLLPTWNSLDDQNKTGGNWLEANPSTERVSEVMKADSTLTLDQDEGYFLGTLFDGSANRDLTFEFLLAELPTVVEGVVVYGDLPVQEAVKDPDNGVTPFNPADFNEDRAVDDLDLAAWEGGYGTSAGATKEMGDFDNNGIINGKDFLGWQANVGASAQAAAVAIPEPACLGLLAAGLGSLALRRRSPHI